jgi:hypothetical protein
MPSTELHPMTSRRWWSEPLAAPPHPRSAMMPRARRMRSALLRLVSGSAEWIRVAV